MKTATHPAREGQAWWRVGMVWLVLAGPATVVVAGFLTAWVAWRDADPVILQTATAPNADDAALTPALKARNHAATPRQP